MVLIPNKIIFAEPCEAGKYLDSSTGCLDCPADHWSGADNKADTCTACQRGKEVGAGLGKQESDCTLSKSNSCSSSLCYLATRAAKGTLQINFNMRLLYI